MSKQKTNKSSYMLFVVIFLVIVVLVIFNNLKNDIVMLRIPNNAGVSHLDTVEKLLICIFQDGKVVTWNWDILTGQTAQFSVNTDRVVLLEGNRLAAIQKTDKKILSVHNLPFGQKEKEFTVGLADQDIWSRISPDQQTILIVSQIEEKQNDAFTYEFKILDLDKEILKSPVILNIKKSTESLVNFAVTNDKKVIAMGQKAERGRLICVDLYSGKILWDYTLKGTKEFCSLAISPSDPTVYAGNRNGILYKLDLESGNVIKEIQLLEKGETRPITNDLSVLNTAFSNDGKYFVTTINPKAYILEASSDTIIHTCFPADRLVSKIAFSPDNKYFATSDIRAGYPIKIWKMPELKE